MSDASDTFRFGLDADDRPAPQFGVALIRACDVIVGDAVTELDSPDGPFYEVLAVEADGFTVDGQDYDGGCEGHEATTCGRYDGPIGETLICDGSCLRPLPVPLEVAPTDRVLVRRAVTPDPAEGPRSGIDPTTVTAAPSGRFGFYRPQPTRYESEPVVAIAQAIARGPRMEWHPTPGRYYDRTILSMRPGVDLAIDAGAGWTMAAADVAALKRFAFGAARPIVEPDSRPRATKVADALSALIAEQAAGLEPGEVAILHEAFRVCQVIVARATKVGV